MKIYRLRNFAEYQHHREQMQAVYAERWEFEKGLQPQGKAPFEVAGFSYPAGREVEFQADFEYSDGQNVNWRERLVCPVTGLNNRLRAAVHIAETELGLATGHIELTVCGWGLFMGTLPARTEDMFLVGLG
jgi:hypothetical protein